MIKRGLTILSVVTIFAVLLAACTPAQVDRALDLLGETNESMDESEGMFDDDDDMDDVDEMDDVDDMDNDDEMDYDGYGVVYRDGEPYCASEINGVISGDIYVGKGETCTLNGAKIEGNVNMMADAVLYAYASSLEGNLEASYSSRIEVHPNSYIAGNVVISNSSWVLLDRSQIDGNVEVMYNSGDQVITSNKISGNLEAKNNSGPIVIEDNMIDGNLVCLNNSTMPTGGNNMVEGNKEGQCAGL